VPGPAAGGGAMIRARSPGRDLHRFAQPGRCCPFDH